MAAHIPGPDQADLWKNRRIMGYYSLAGLFVMIFVASVKELNAAQADLLGTVALAFSAVVITYMGGVVVDAMSKRKSDVASDVADVPRSASGVRRGAATDAADRRETIQPAREGD